MRKLWVVALANLAVVGLVLTAIITNVVSACSSADGCGSAPPYIYVGLVLVLLGCIGLFLLFRKWRGAAASGDQLVDLTDDDSDVVPQGKRATQKRADKAHRANQRDVDAAEETTSRNRLGRIRGAAADQSPTMEDGALSDDDDAAQIMSVEPDAEIDWPPAVTPEVGDAWSTDDSDKSNDQLASDQATEEPASDAQTKSVDGERDAAGSNQLDEEFGVAWAVDDEPAISSSNLDSVRDIAATEEGEQVEAFVLPIIADADSPALVVADSGDDRHVSLDRIFAGPPAADSDSADVDIAPDTDDVASPDGPQRFDDCAPAGFPATVSDLRALIEVLSLDILLDKQARDDIAAWAAVLAPLGEADPIGPADCEAFAQWIDALAERHNADLSATVAHALYQRGGGSHDPYRSAA